MPVEMAPVERGAPPPAATTRRVQANTLSRTDLLRAGCAAILLVWLTGMVLLAGRLVYGLVVALALCRSGRPISLEGIDDLLDQIPQ